MSDSSNSQGRAYEFAWMTVLEKELSEKRKVNVIKNSSYWANKKAWDKINPSVKKTYIDSANAAVESVLELEPRLEEDDGQALTLEFQKDEEGIKGDVTVALSSMARDKFLAAKFRFSYSSLYIRPGITIAKY